MAKSGMTLEASKGGNLAHNNREHQISYLIDGDYFCDKTEAEAKEYLKSLQIEAKKNYVTRTKQKMQIDPADTKYLWSASVNLNKEHTLEDIQNLAKVLEKKYGWQAIQCAVHQDEGKPDGTRKNLHAHIEFYMVKKDGTTAFKKKHFRQREMSELQTFVANFLKMERGEIYRETGNYKKHLKPNSYRAKMRELEAKEEENETFKYNYRDMQRYITSLEDLTKEQKKGLHQFNSKVKNDKATIDDLNNLLQKFQDEQSSSNVGEISILKDENATLEKEVKETKSNVEQSLIKIGKLEEENSKLKEEISFLYCENRTLKKFARAVKKIISEKLTNSPIHNLEDVLRKIKEYFNIKDAEPIEVEKQDDTEHVKLKLLHEELSTVETKYKGKIVSVTDFIHDIYADGYIELKALKTGEKCLVNEDTEQKYNLKDEKYAEYADLYIKAQDAMYSKVQTKGSLSEVKDEDQPKSKVRKNR